MPPKRRSSKASWAARRQRSVASASASASSPEAQTEAQPEAQPEAQHNYCCYVLAGSETQGSDARGAATQKRYVGSTCDLHRRVRQHNGEISGGARRTSGRGPWSAVLALVGFGPDQKEALRAEWRVRRCGVRRKGATGVAQGLADYACGGAPLWTSSSGPVRRPDLRLVVVGGGPRTGPRTGLALAAERAAAAAGWGLEVTRDSGTLLEAVRAAQRAQRRESPSASLPDELCKNIPQPAPAKGASGPEGVTGAGREKTAAAPAAAPAAVPAGARSQGPRRGAARTCVGRREDSVSEPDGPAHPDVASGGGPAKARVNTAELAASGTASSEERCTRATRAASPPREAAGIAAPPGPGIPGIPGTATPHSLIARRGS